MTMRLLSVAILFVISFGNVANAEGMVSKIISSPIFANGTVTDIRSGINIYLQTDAAKGLDFLDPKVPGFGIPAGGRMEVELEQGFQRDPEVPLDERALIFTVGTPQQGLPAKLFGLQISQGKNQNTFEISVRDGQPLRAGNLRSPAPGARMDPHPASGIKIIHIGRNMAFISRGQVGRISVRLFDGENTLIASGVEEIRFLPEPMPQIFPTNITHNQRNHDWQRVPLGGVVGVAKNTIPIPFLVFDRNEGFGNIGLDGVGVLSAEQLRQGNFTLPDAISRFNGGLIVQDSTGDGFMDPNVDRIVGGLTLSSPQNAQGFQVITPLVKNKPFLSKPTSQFDEKAGKAFGGSILQVVAVAGSLPGIYRATLTLLKEPGNLSSGDGASVTTTIVAE